MELIIRECELPGLGPVDVAIADGVVARIEPARIGRARGGPSGRPAEVVDGRGGLLLPGLHDHHLHLMALAAARTSVSLGPPEVHSPEDLDQVVRDADRRTPQGQWLRCTGYHETVAGPLDRHRLDRLAPGRAIRVQHRTGAMWVLSTAALERLGDLAAIDGIDRDPDGRPTGAVYGNDAAVRRAVGSMPAPDLSSLATQFSSYGITGLTDATPYASIPEAMALIEAVRRVSMPQHLVVTGGAAIASWQPPEGRLGPVKMAVDDHRLPPIEALVAAVTEARRAGRCVAIHCVTQIGAVVALAALEQVGAVEGDRLEHGSVLDADLVERIAAMGLTVVTQPNFIAERGDQYSVDVDAVDLPNLYRCGSLIDAGVAVAGSTDAPFGDPDPWKAIAAAMERRTRLGVALGASEALDATSAIGLFLGDPQRPGVRRPITVGSPADLCLLQVPSADTASIRDASVVAATVIGGSVEFLAR